MSAAGWPSRADDEISLRALDMWRRGEDEISLNQQLGRNPTYARVLARRVCRADLAESGEPRDRVVPFYQRGRI